MTATDTAAAVTGITNEQLAALQNGGWRDGDGVDTPGWGRMLEDEAEADAEGEDGGQVQLVYPVDDGRWETEHRVFTDIASDSRQNMKIESQFNWWNSLEEALAGCDELAGDRKPAKPGSATEQEDRFALGLRATGG